MSLYFFSHLRLSLCIFLCILMISFLLGLLTLIPHVIDTVAGRFSFKDLVELTYFLQIEVKHALNEIALSQNEYILEIISKVDMTLQMGYDTHVFKFTTLSKRFLTHVDTTLYRHTLDKLQYLSFTLHNIVFVVNKLSYYDALQRSKEDSSISQVISKIVLANISSRDKNLYMHVDVDWVGSPSDRISISCYILFM